jgi:hypothetical protein
MNQNETLPLDFLGIGAPRSGTSWLWENLRHHPEIWMPYRKELHYFDRSTSYPSPSHLSQPSPLKRLFGLSEPSHRYRRILAKSAHDVLRQPSVSRASWYLNYLFGHYDDEWYASLFAQGAGKLKGEVTPAYAILKSEDVANIHSLMPDIKLIYLMRNPIERSWSAVRKGARKAGWDPKEAPIGKLLELATSTPIDARAVLSGHLADLANPLPARTVLHWLLRRGCRQSTRSAAENI